MTLNNWYKIIVGKFLHWRIRHSLNTEKIQREMCNVEGNLISFIFDRNNLVEINECLHEEYLNNKEDIHILKNKNEQLLKRLQDTCSSSYVSNCHMVDLLGDSHDMMDH